MAKVAKKSWYPSTPYSNSTSFLRPFSCFQYECCRRTGPAWVWGLSPPPPDPGCDGQWTRDLPHESA